MTQVTIELYAGAVIVRSGGQVKSFDRLETGKITLNLDDHPDAETPDNERWDPFQEAASFFEGKPITPAENETCYRNNLYTVIVTRTEAGGAYLTIKRNDRHWAHDWRHFQRIKNELLGTDVEAVELYPCEDRLVDEANQYHLWALPPGVRYPLGFEERVVSGDDEPPMDGAKQRPRGDTP